MEYMEYGDLGQYLKRFGMQNETNAKEITQQILEGLVVLHKSYICHRDLKPEVWLLKETLLMSRFDILKKFIERPYSFSLSDSP